MSLLAYTSLIVLGVITPGVAGRVMVGSRVVPGPGAGCANASTVSRKPNTETRDTAATSFFMVYLL
jgi:hypothetical protein